MENKGGEEGKKRLKAANLKQQHDEKFFLCFGGKSASSQKNRTDMKLGEW